MRYFLFIIFLVLGTGVFAHKADSLELVKSVADLNSALISRDTFKLKVLLRDDLHYYHSNGWEQLKKDVIEDLYNGKLTYKRISPSEQSVHFIGNNLAQVKMVADIEAVLNGKPIHLNLNVVQMWGWKDNRWELFSRLSKKVLIN